MAHKIEIHEDGTITYNGDLYVKLILPEAKAQTTRTKEEVFAELVKDLVRKEDPVQYPNSIFWFDKDGRWMFEYDKKYNYFFCQYDRVWGIFEEDFSMDYNEIQAFIKDWVEEHFKLKGVTPRIKLVIYGNWVEEHFKLKGVTPECVYDEEDEWWRSISN